MTRRPSVRQIVLCIAVVILASCGGGGGDAGVAIDVGLAISFPPQNSSTPEDILRVTGTTLTGADLVMVGGIAATSDDGFLTWKVDLPLVPGPNDASVIVKLGAASATVETLRIRREDDRPRPILALAMGNDGSFLYVSRYYPSPLTRVHPDGRMEVIDMGWNGFFNGNIFLVYDAARNRAILSGYGWQGVSIIDLLSASITMSVQIPDGDVSGLSFDQTTGTTYIAANRNDNGTNLACFLYALAPQASSVTLISGSSNAAPAGNVALHAIDYDPVSRLAIGWDYYAQSLVQIDTLTGQRSFIVSNTTPGYLAGISIVPGGQAVRLLENSGVCYEIALATGAASSIPLPVYATPTDPAFDSDYTGQALYVGLEAESTQSTLLIRSDRIVRLHDDGRNDEIWRASRGESPSLEWETFHRLAFDSIRKRVLSDSHGEILAVDCVTGDVEPIPGQVPGPNRPWVTQMVHDPVGDRILYLSVGHPNLSAAAGVYTMAADSGPQSLYIQPVVPSAAGTTLDYDPITAEVAVLAGYSWTGINSFGVARYLNPAGIYAYTAVPSLGIASGFFHLNAQSRSVFAVEQSGNMISKLNLTTGIWTPVLPRSTDGNQYVEPPLSMFHDAVRNELITLEWNLLRITDLGTGLVRQKRLHAGEPDDDPELLGLTRDLESGLIYVGSSHHPYIMVLEPETLAISYLHY